MSAAPLLLLAALLLGSKKKSTTPAPLPKPLGKPPATVTPITAAPNYVVPGSPPAGGVIPGSPPNGGALPGSAPKGAKAPGPYVEKPTPNSTPAKQQGMVTAPFVSMPAAKPYVAPKKTTTAKKPAAKVAAKKPAAKVASKPASPAGTVKAAPVLESHNRGSTPAGYDPVKARSRARALAAYLAKKGPAGYSHDELKSWQLQAAITPDGKYGGSARGALIFYGVKDPPRPFFAPVATLPYIPPEKR
jgi:hypothetical protein